MSARARQLTAVLAACSALALGACGSSDDPEGDPLPSDAVAELETRLDEIERRYQDAVDNGNVGACDDIGIDSMPAIDQVIAGLPDSVDPELRTALDRSFARLQELTEAECAGVEPVETAPEPTPEPPPEETIPEETIPEETVPLETTPEELPPPEEKGQGKDKAKDQGGGVEVPPGLEGDD